jgi:hypothetical protein
MVLSPPRDVLEAFRERGFDPADFADFLDWLFEAAFRAGFFFFGAVRFADFFLAAMTVSWGSGRKP